MHTDRSAISCGQYASPLLRIHVMDAVLRFEVRKILPKPFPGIGHPRRGRKPARFYAAASAAYSRVSTGAGQKMQEIRVRIANPPCIRIIFGLLVKLP